MVGGAAAIVALALLSIAFGSTVIPLGDVLDAFAGALGLGDGQGSGPVRSIVVDLRLPRTILAGLVGAGLGIVGALLQTVTRNDLADPFLFGLSSGAAAGAVSVITVFGDRLGIWTLPVAAFPGGMLAALVVLGVRQFLGRPAGDAPAELPGWMRALEGFGRLRAASAGLALAAANPKNALLAVAPASIVAEADLAAAGQAVPLGAFVLVASLGVLAPLVIHVALGARSRAVLDALRGWLVANNAVVMAVLLVVVGTLVVGDAVAALTA